MSAEKGRTTRKNTGNRIFIKITVGLVLIFAVASAVAIYFDQETQMLRMLEKRETLASQMEDALGEQAELQELENMVDTDEYIERIARDQLGMVRPNEIIFED